MTSTLRLVLWISLAISNPVQALFTPQEYGIDWDGPIPLTDDDADQVTVPECECPLTEEQFTQLQDTILPLESSDNYGIDLFNAVVEHVQANIS